MSATLDVIDGYNATEYDTDCMMSTAPEPESMLDAIWNDDSESKKESLFRHDKDFERFEELAQPKPVNYTLIDGEKAVLDLHDVEHGFVQANLETEYNRDNEPRLEKYQTIRMKTTRFWDKRYLNGFATEKHVVSGVRTDISYNDNHCDKSLHLTVPVESREQALEMLFACLQGLNEYEVLHK